MNCKACGDATARPYCHFCQRTIDLIESRRCVSCTAPIFDESDRQEGRCGECLSRQVIVCAATRKLLILAASVRHMRRVRMAA